MRIEPEEAPASAPSPKDSFSMAVTNYDYFAKRDTTHSVQFVPPCLVRWGIEPLQVLAKRPPFQQVQDRRDQLRCRYFRT